MVKLFDNQVVIRAPGNSRIVVLVPAIENTCDSLNNNLDKRLTHEVNANLVITFCADRLAELYADGQDVPFFQIHVQVKRTILVVEHL